MARYKFSIQFIPEEGAQNDRELDAQQIRQITNQVATLQPKPIACRFNEDRTEEEAEGWFTLYFLVDAATEFAATESASDISEQITKLALPHFKHDFSRIASH